MSDSATNLGRRIARHPGLQARIEAILNIMESSGDELKLADEAERQIIETLRQMGHEALLGWAEQRVEATARQGREVGRSMGKKNSTGTAPTE